MKSELSVSVCVLVLPTDVQQMLVIKEVVPLQWSPSEDPWGPQPLHIQEEQEDRWTIQTAEHLTGMEEGDASRVPLSAAPVAFSVKDIRDREIWRRMRAHT